MTTMSANCCVVEEDLVAADTVDQRRLEERRVVTAVEERRVGAVEERRVAILNFL